MFLEAEAAMADFILLNLRLIQPIILVYEELQLQVKWLQG